MYIAIDQLVIEIKSNFVTCVRVKQVKLYDIWNQSELPLVVIYR